MHSYSPDYFKPFLWKEQATVVTPHLDCECPFGVHHIFISLLLIFHVFLSNGNIKRPSDLGEVRHALSLSFLTCNLSHLPAHSRHLRFDIELRWKPADLEYSSLTFLSLFEYLLELVFSIS